MPTSCCSTRTRHARSGDGSFTTRATTRRTKASSSAVRCATSSSAAGGWSRTARSSANEAGAGTWIGVRSTAERSGPGAVPRTARRYPRGVPDSVFGRDAAGVAWRPTAEHLSESRVARFLQREGADLESIQGHAVNDPAWFWREALDDLDLRWQRQPDAIFELDGDGWAFPRWWIGGSFNHPPAPPSPRTPGHPAPSWGGGDGEDPQPSWAGRAPAVR